MNALTRYIDAWLEGDADRVASTVAVECVITECYGPIYRGRAYVRWWAEEWFAAGGVIHRWDVNDIFSLGEQHVAQWTFDFTWRGKRSLFDGASIARSSDGLVSELREYQTTAPLYEWHGTWRP